MANKKTVNEQILEATKESIKAQKKKQKVSPVSGKKIISIDGKLQAKTKDSANEEALITLTESLKGGKVLTGKIAGVEGDLAILWVGDDFKVMIPAQECIDISKIHEDSNAKSEEEVKKQINYMLSKRLGSEIDYIVKGINEEHEIAVASRIEAMKKAAERWHQKDENGRPYIYEGCLIEARIVGAIRTGIIVEIFGVETFIKANELSYQRIQDATKDFEVGSRIIVKVLSVERDDETGEVVIAVSAKQANPNPYLKAMKRYVVGSKYIGEVTMADQNGIFVALDGGVDCLCRYPERGERPQRGAKVTVRITIKNEEMNRIFGNITHVAGC